MMQPLIPFNALRYNPEKIKDMSEVITPPYDVIGPLEQERFYRKSKYNVIRMVLGRKERGDGPGDNQYTRARNFLNTWLEKRILIREKEEALYFLKQEFDWSGQKKSRRGIIGVFALDASARVRPHEHTIASPREDRFSLLSACQTNFSPVFMLYSDSQRQDLNLWARVEEREPLHDFLGPDNTRQILWKVTDPEILQAVQAIWRGKHFLIADGHHRFEVALSYFKENPWANTLLTCVSTWEDEGLLILPTHRIVEGIEWAGLPPVMERYFSIEEKAVDLKEGQSPVRSGIGMLTPERKFYLLQLKDESIMEVLLPTFSPVYRRMEVVVLERLIIEKILGVQQDGRKKISYTRSIEEAAKTTSQNQSSVAFFLPCPRSMVVEAVVEHGERLPQKTTYFYPKLPSGLVMNLLEQR